MSQNKVVFSLVGFKADSDQHTTTPTTMDWLKNKLREPKRRNFSLNFKQVNEITIPKKQGVFFDIHISVKFDCLIFSISDSLYIYGRNCKTLLQEIKLKHDTVVSQMDEEDDALYLMVCDSENYHCYKYKISSLIKCDNTKHELLACLTWKSKRGFNNPYGVSVFQKYVLILEFEMGLLALDRETGLESNIILPEVTTGSSIRMIQDKYLITSTDETQLEFFEYCSKELEWKCIKSIVIPYRVFSIFYEDNSQYVYLSDNRHNEGGIIVMRLSDFEIFKEYKRTGLTSGLGVDYETGELYVCGSKTISVYQ